MDVGSGLLLFPYYTPVCTPSHAHFPSTAPPYSVPLADPPDALRKAAHDPLPSRPPHKAAARLVVVVVVAALRSAGTPLRCCYY